MVVLGVEDDRYDAVRRLAHVSKITFPNDKLKPIVERGDTAMQKATGNYTWVSSDADWLTALKVSDYFAAIEICDGLPNEDCGPLREGLDKDLKKLNGIDETSSSSTFAVSGSINISNELDPNVYLPTQDVFTNS